MPVMRQRKEQEGYALLGTGDNATKPAGTSAHIGLERDVPSCSTADEPQLFMPARSAIYCFIRAFTGSLTFSILSISTLRRPCDVCSTLSI
jgi:hypothetical protein